MRTVQEMLAKPIIDLFFVKLPHCSFLKLELTLYVLREKTRKLLKYLISDFKNTLDSDGRGLCYLDLKNARLTTIFHILLRQTATSIEMDNA